MVNLRLIENSDIPAIFIIEQSAHISPWSEKLLKDSFGARSHNFLAEDKGDVIGYVFSSFVAGELTLENICVAPSHQRQGVGRLLMQHLLEQAAKLEAEEIWLEVRASNVSAIELYHRFGFRNQGVRKGYYSVPQSTEKEDAILMNLKL